MADDDETSDAVPAPAAQTGAAGIAVALGRASRSRAVDVMAAQYLEKQSALVDLQMEHLHEERALHHRHMALRYFGDRLRIALQILTIVAGLVVAAGLGALIWRAREDHGLVVEAFSVPPDLVQRGLTGQVVASRLLDKLTDMQAQTASLRPADSYANNWGSDLKVEIPETGVSIGELQRLLVAWFGNQTHISGEVVRTPAGLEVAARTGGAPARTFAGADGDVDRLLQSAAEAVYGATQPYRYAVFLDEHGRAAQARPLLERLVQRGDKLDRYWAAIYLAQEDYIGGDWRTAMAIAGGAVDAEPTFASGYAVRAAAEDSLGHWEGALRDYRKAAQLISQDPSRNQDLAAADNSEEGIRQAVAEFEDDWREAAVEGARSQAAQASLGSHEHSLEDANAIAGEAQDLAQDHDRSAAYGLLARAEVPVKPGSGADLGAMALNRIFMERAAEDWMSLVAEIPHFVGVTTPAAERVGRAPSAVSTFAYGLARVGRLKEAEALEATTPGDCYPCLVDRGAIATLRHDFGAAERWFAEAVRQGPSVPDAYLEWARMRLARGDADGAVRLLAVAHRRGPHYADVAELWGEALMRKRDFAGAAARFQDAAKDAPRWGRDHLLWGAALAAMSEGDAARRRWDAAADMDLSAEDRRTLGRLRNPR